MCIVKITSWENIVFFRLVTQNWIILSMEGEKKSSLSFGFAKKKEQKVLKKGAIEDQDKPAEEETEFVASFDRKGLKRFIHSFLNY